mgnify:CR=1 FL=1
MAKQQLKDPKKGYAPDFVTRILKDAGRTGCGPLRPARGAGHVHEVLRRLFDPVVDVGKQPIGPRTAKQRNIRLITNAGGMNIQGCVDAIRGWAQGEGLKGYKIGYVTGDDIKDPAHRSRRRSPGPWSAPGCRRSAPRWGSPARPSGARGASRT